MTSDAGDPGAGRPGAAGAGDGRPALGVFKFASCDGCQLAMLSLERDLLAVAEALELRYFTEATSRRDPEGPFDLALVEGSISTPEQEEEILRLRRRSRFLVTIGACATAGGIQALRNWADAEEYVRGVYARPAYVRTLATSTPISDHVEVDFELRGCPIDRGQLLEVIRAFLLGARPQIRDEAVCLECKRRGIVCVMVAEGIPCLGPVVHTGCGVLCPDFRRGCYGCFGPREWANTRSLAAWERNRGRSDDEIRRWFRGFTGYRTPFREESERHGRD